MTGTTLPADSRGATIPDVTHHSAEVNGTTLHYVSAGTSGSPVLLVHGFPETWWVFHKLIPLLSDRYRVFAVDVRGFGDSAPAPEPGFDCTVAAADLAALITALDVGPVHLCGQDINGPTVYRLAATHPELLHSLSALETGLPGFGFEALADVTHGGAWHVGMLAAPGVARMLLTGRERPFIADYAVPGLNATPGTFTDADIDELVRAYALPDGLSGAAGLYAAALRDGDAVRTLAEDKLLMPVLAVGGGGGGFTESSMRSVATDVRAAQLDGVGHYLAMEAPERLADILRSFFADVDGTRAGR